MRKAHSFFSVLLVLLVVMVLAVGQAAAARGGGVTARLSAAQESFGANQEVLMTVTLRNTTTSPVKLLKWYTLAEGMEESLFVVTRDGKRAAYLGPIYKRPAPTPADYITLQPGQKLVRQVNLAEFYDFSESGMYEIRYRASAWNLYAQPEGEVFAGTQQIASGKIFVNVTGRAPRQQVFSAPEAVTGSTAFNKCTTTQQSTLLSARTEASNYSANALSYLQSNKTGARYTTWFGVVTTSRYSLVTDHFAKISSAMDTAPVTFDCACKKRYYAYVYPSQPYKIYLCSAFWTAPMTGTDSKAGTLIHEMSHFTVVAGTDDYVYGQAGAKNLAITNPDQAVRNADNHEYFAENTPALP